MKKSSLFSISALAAISALTLAGCAADAGESENAGSTRACVILPDADSGTRWEPGDRPALEGSNRSWLRS